jgi:hypothetical protein
MGEQQHPRCRLHLRWNPTRPRTTTRSEDLHLEGTCRHHAWAIVAGVSSRNPARADGSTGHSVASVSCPPRTSARIVASATRLQRRSRQWTARPGNRTKGAHPFDSDMSSMGAQAHTSCNRHAGYYVRETAPPLAPVPRLLDCGTSAATRGNPAHGPTVPTEHIDYGSVSRERRRDGRYGQKWAGSNGGGRRAEAAVKSSAGTRPLLGQRESPLPRREDNTPVSRSSNGSRTHNGCPANHLSRRINSVARQATPLVGEVGDASPPP